MIFTIASVKKKKRLSFKKHPHVNHDKLKSLPHFLTLLGKCLMKKEEINILVCWREKKLRHRQCNISSRYASYTTHSG